MSQRIVTWKAVAAAFAEWDRRYREDPAGFDTSWHESSTAVEYGDRAADYLFGLLKSAGALATLASERLLPPTLPDESEASAPDHLYRSGNVPPGHPVGRVVAVADREVTVRIGGDMAETVSIDRAYLPEVTVGAFVSVGPAVPRRRVSQ